MGRSLAVLLAVVAASLGTAPAEEPRVKFWVGVQKQAPPAAAWGQALPRFDPVLRLQVASPLDAFRTARPGAPGATVVVWGEASQARQEEMQRFARDYAPMFQSAFDAGQASGVGGQFLSQLMVLSGNPNQNPAPATAPSVWYNAMDPWARDPKYWR